MSYTRTKRILVDYIDHDYRIVGTGQNQSVQVYEVPKQKPVDINVIVETEPFDRSVDNCGNHIGNLTESIVGFKTANVISKQENEKAIVNSATSGFASLIDQNLSLQNAGLEAQMHALAGELMQQCKVLSDKHEVMNKDFNRIKSRYTGLFETINKEMDSRMKQLIKPCFEFVSQVRQEQNRRIESNLLSTATTGGKESDSARIALQTSKMKRNAELLIASASDFISSNKSLSRSQKSFFIEGGSGEIYYAPVIYFSGHNEHTAQEEKYYSNSLFSGRKDVEETILNCVKGVGEKDFDPESKSKIRDYYNKLLSEISDGSTRSQRIVALMNQFINNSQIKTFNI